MKERHMMSHLLFWRNPCPWWLISSLLLPVYVYTYIYIYEYHLYITTSAKYYVLVRVLFTQPPDHFLYTQFKEQQETYFSSFSGQYFAEWVEITWIFYFLIPYKYNEQQYLLTPHTHTQIISWSLNLQFQGPLYQLSTYILYLFGTINCVKNGGKKSNKFLI